MACHKVQGGVVCTGFHGVAPPGYHMGWGKDGYPKFTKRKNNVIRCFDCDEPAITCDFWAYALERCYCENCAYVHMDIDPVTREKRKVVG